MTEFEQMDDRGRLMELLTGAEPVVEDYLPAGPGVSAEEVGERGPWYGYRFPDGTVEGWARNRAATRDLCYARLSRLTANAWLEIVAATLPQIAAGRAPEEGGHHA